jgi:hypothetical protein
MWTNGKMDGYEFFVKHYDEGSQYGIGEGKISKLSIRKDDTELYNYDRGLDFDRLDENGKAVYEKLLERYN